MPLQATDLKAEDLQHHHQAAVPALAICARRLHLRSLPELQSAQMTKK